MVIVRGVNGTAIYCLYWHKFCLLQNERALEHKDIHTTNLTLTLTLAPNEADSLPFFVPVIVDVEGFLLAVNIKRYLIRTTVTDYGASLNLNLTTFSSRRYSLGMM